MDIRAFQQQVGYTARSHGFDERDVAQKFLLIIGEIIEAYEEVRKGRSIQDVYASPDVTLPQSAFRWVSARGTFEVDGDTFSQAVTKASQKLLGVPVELADAFIRILSFSEGHGLDMESMAINKDEYNKERPYKHGKEF